MGIQVTVINNYTSFVPYTRMETLGLHVLRGVDQKPYDGKIDYDVWITIDSDIVFRPEQVIELIKDTEKYPVVSGLYKMTDSWSFPCVKNWDMEYYKRAGTLPFLNSDDVKNEPKYISVAYNGLGFFACRRGVIEKLKYPYFSYPIIDLEAEDGKILKVMCSEDVAFCKNLTDAGFDIMVNTGLVVGHEKTLVI